MHNLPLAFDLSYEYERSRASKASKFGNWWFFDHIDINHYKTHGSHTFTSDNLHNASFFYLSRAIFSVVVVRSKSVRWVPGDFWGQSFLGSGLYGKGPNKILQNMVSSFVAHFHRYSSE